MDEEESDEPQPAKPLPVMGQMAIAAGVLLLLDLLGWVLAGGGLLSVASAVRAAAAKAPFIDVDSEGLRFPALVLTGLVVVILCRLASIDLAKRSGQILLILSMVGGGFLFDIFWSEAVITRYMASHGYSRCEARDHRVGNGKSQVWFDDFVLRPAECPAQHRSG